MSGLRSWFGLISVVLFFGNGLNAEPDPDSLLRRALQLADFYNWIDAGPAFAEAERIYAARGDARNAQPCSRSVSAR